MFKHINCQHSTGAFPGKDDPIHDDDLEVEGPGLQAHSSGKRGRSGQVQRDQQEEVQEAEEGQKAEEEEEGQEQYRCHD